MDGNALTGRGSFRGLFQRNILAGKGYHEEDPPEP